MYVRSFQLSDCSAVTSLLGEVLSDDCFDETMDAFANQLSLDSELVLVAEKNEQIIGVIIGTIDNNKGYYYRIAVDRHFRRKGVGKMMIQSLRSMFERRNVKKVLVTVDEHNEPILFVYESLGFPDTVNVDAIQKLKIIADSVIITK